MKKAVKFVVALSVAVLMIGGFVVVGSHTAKPQQFASDPGGGRPIG